jgi:hypothetical protein
MLSENIFNLAATLAAIALSKRDLTDDTRDTLECTADLLRSYAVDVRTLERHTVPLSVRITGELPPNAVSLEAERVRRAVRELPR